MGTPEHPDFERGRAAASAKVPTRFGLAERELDGDWRDHVEGLAKDEGGPPVKLLTTVTEEHPKSIISFNRSPDIPFDRSINAYRGCEHVMSGILYPLPKSETSRLRRSHFWEEDTGWQASPRLKPISD